MACEGGWERDRGYHNIIHTYLRLKSTIRNTYSIPLWLFGEPTTKFNGNSLPKKFIQLCQSKATVIKYHSVFTLGGLVSRMVVIMH